MTAQKEVKRSMNAFAKNFYQCLKETTTDIDGNIFFGPPNIYAVLAMLKAGADNQAHFALKNVMCISEDSNNFDKTFCKVWKGMLQANNDSKDRNFSVVLNYVNRLWIQEGFDILDDYINYLGNHYWTYLIKKDFRRDVDEAINYINKWVEESTDGKIKDLLNRTSVTSATRLLVTSVISFTGAWDEPFDPCVTSEMPFYTLSGKEIPVPMMYTKSSFYYKEDDELNCKILALKYESPSSLRYLILLPNERDGLPSLEAAMLETGRSSRTLNRFEVWEKHRLHQYSDIHVFLPRFKIYEKSDVTRVLKNMGLVFNGADFSKISPKEDVVLSDISHAASLEVNEKGTEAQCSTSGGAVAAGCPEYREFRVDHPCLFMIYDHDTSIILFLGRLCKPFE